MNWSELKPGQLEGSVSQLSPEEAAAWCDYHRFKLTPDYSPLERKLAREAFDLGMSACRACLDTTETDPYFGRFIIGSHLIEAGAQYEDLDEVVGFYRELAPRMDQHQKSFLLFWFFGAMYLAEGETKERAQEFYISEILEFEYAEADLYHFSTYHRLHELLAENPELVLTESQWDRIAAKLEGLQHSEFAKVYNRFKNRSAKNLDNHTSPE
ncbi:MAG TPA: hypothetical protein VK171_11990, partial [Fimbriimonas sp.]|nr:hypothetical protein [Fimbriimonas sp.]